jgi:hypothetical protein
VFDGWSAWTWVAIAWLQLLLAYGGYLAYLGWRRRRVLERATDVPAHVAGAERGRS